jgi:hypothetical protein
MSDQARRRQLGRERQARYRANEPARQPNIIPAVARVEVEAEGRVLTILAATFREALRAASRLVYHGKPVALRVLNAAEIARQFPRIP